MNVITSVVHPNTLNLDPAPGFWPNLEPDPGFWPNLDPDPGFWPNLDPDPGYTINFERKKNLNNFRERLPLKGIFLKKNKMSPQEIFTQLRKSLNYEFIS